MNVTLSIDDRLVERARKLASQRGTTLNAMIRELLEQVTASSAPENLLPELERMWAETRVDSGGRDWKREDLYDRPVLR
ncbi:MAG: hypothetical protein Kow001_12740 [Acidobacteriota bacterium]